jgi:hypothetical protein
MELDKEKTEVIFRKYNDRGDIIALFPYIIGDHMGNILCYQQIGQHGAADYNAVIKQTTLATPEEYEDLFNELTNHFGYNLKIIKRKNHSKYIKEYFKSKKDTCFS